MIIACILFSVMNATVYEINILDKSIPASVISFSRIIINLSILTIPALFHGNIGVLFGDFRGSLWLRGFFGGLSLMLSFASINRIGPGESTFLAASNGLFVAALCPFVLKQKNSLLIWLAIVGAFIGVLLLVSPHSETADLWGRVMALLSGLFAAFAYLMVAKAGKSNSPSSVIFYFCFVSFFIHMIYFYQYDYQIPEDAQIWVLLIFTGCVGSGAQYFMTRAYQRSPAAQVTAVGYLQPVLSLAWSILFFNLVPDCLALLGAILILLFGVFLPFAHKA